MVDSNLLILAYISGVGIGVLAGSSIIVNMARENARNAIRRTIVYLLKEGVLSFDQTRYDKLKKELGL